MLRIHTLLPMLALCACQTTGPVQIKTVEVDKPIPTHAITKDQIPPLPAPLGPRPQSAQAAADVALAGRCDALAFVIRAYPLLEVAAGIAPLQAPIYPECASK